MTKLYFHAVNSNLANLPTAEQSASRTSAKDAEAQTINRSMNDAKGIAQTSIVLASLANTASNDYYFTRFVSDPLKGITSISAQTWNFACACAESNASANFPNSGSNLLNPVVVYVWRPGTGKVGDITDGSTAATFSEPTVASTETSEFATFSGSAVASVQDDDVIICEIWFRTTQATTTSRNNTFYFDGTTETNNTATTVSNHASYIETPQTLTFRAIKALTETVTISDSLNTTVTPGAGHNANILIKKTTLTLDATSGTHDQSFTGVGFQPKAVIMWGVLVSANNTYAEGLSASYGFSDGTNSVAVSCANVDAATTLDNSCMLRNDACLSLLSAAAGNAEIVRSKVKTFDSDGVTLTHTTKTNTTQYIIHALFIGGTDITNVIAKQDTVQVAATGNRGYTGYGFKPDVVLFGAVNNVTVNTLTAALGLSVGAGENSSQQFNRSIARKDAVTANTGGTAFSAYYNDTVMCVSGSSTTNQIIRAALVSLDTDGFTLNHIRAASSSTYPFIALAIKGGYWDVGSILQKTSTGNLIITEAISADPEGLLLYGSDDTAVNTESSSAGSIDGTVSIGGADNTAEGYVFFGDTMIVSPVPSVMISSTSKVIRNATPNATATSSALTAEADASDMATVGQFTLNWSTADATARRIGYVVLSKGPPASTGNAVAKTLTETVTISDSSPAPTRLAAKIRTGTETVAIGQPSPSRLAAKIRTRTETIIISDAIARIKGKVKTLTETVTIGQPSPTRQAAKIRTKTETITISDSVLRPAAKIRGKTETVTIGQPTPTRQTAKSRTISQSIVISDGLTRLAAKIRALPSEAVTISDAVARTASHGGIAITKTLTETITIVEVSLIRRATKIRTLAAQSLTISDAVTRPAAKFRTLIESITVPGTVTRARGILKTLTESIGLTGAVTRLAAKIRPITQSLTINDSPLTRLAAKIRAVSPTQTITFSDSVTRTLSHGAQQITRTLTEAITISDGLTRQANKIRALAAQSLTVPGTVTRLAAKTRTISQSITFSDAVNRTITQAGHAVRTLIETITLSDSATRQAAKKRALPSETITLAGSPTTTKAKIRALVLQTVTFGDSVIRKGVKIRALPPQTLTIADLLRSYKNGLELVPPQKPDKGGWFWRPPKIKMIRYPVYVVSERERLQRRQKLREYPPLVIIPAFKYNINETTAPFIINNLPANKIEVRFAIASKSNSKILYTGEIVPISLVSPMKSNRLNRAKCIKFVANQQAIDRYARKLDKLSKVMTLLSLARQLFTSHD